MPSSYDIPYDEIDLTIIPLVRALNDLPGIRTIESCGGHENPNVPWQKPLGSWYVTFVCISPDGVRSLDAINGARSWLPTGATVTTRTYTAGENPVFYRIDGAGITPELVAALIAECYNDSYNGYTEPLPHKATLYQWRLWK